MTPSRHLRVPSRGLQPRWSLASSPHLAERLRDTLGNAAATELIGIVDRAATDIAEVKADLAELRQEMEIGFRRLETSIGREVAVMAGQLSEKIEKSRSDLIIWSFVFWVGAVTSIAFLARALQP